MLNLRQKLRNLPKPQRIYLFSLQHRVLLGHAFKILHCDPKRNRPSRRLPLPASMHQLRQQTVLKLPKRLPGPIRALCDPVPIGQLRHLPRRLLMFAIFVNLQPAKARTRIASNAQPTRLSCSLAKAAPAGTPRKAAPVFLCRRRNKTATRDAIIAWIARFRGIV